MPQVPLPGETVDLLWRTLAGGIGQSEAIVHSYSKGIARLWVHDPAYQSAQVTNALQGSGIVPWANPKGPYEIGRKGGNGKVAYGWTCRMPAWAKKGPIVEPVRKAGFWPPGSYGVCSGYSDDRQIFHIAMFDENRKACGGANLWLDDDSGEWTAADWTFYELPARSAYSYLLE